MKTLLRVAALAAWGLGAMAATHVVDHLFLNDGVTAMKGTITLYGPSGGPYQATTRTVTIGSGGLVDVSLVGCPGCAYRAQYALVNDEGKVTLTFEDSRWIVPDTTSVLTVRQLWGGSSAPYYLISQQQINAAGLGTNQAWAWNGTAWIARDFQGPTGATGPAGATGATGPAGPPGPGFAGFRLTDLESMTGAITLQPLNAGGDRFIGTLVGNATINVDTLTAQPNQMIFVDFGQDATGGRTVTFSNQFAGYNCADPTPLAHYTQLFVWDGSVARAYSPGTSDGSVSAIITNGCHTVTVPEVTSKALLEDGAQPVRNKTLYSPLFSGAFGSDVDLGTHAQTVEIANASSTGTTVNKLAKLTGAPSTAVLAGTSDTNGIIGIVIGGAGTTGNAQVARMGQATCAFDAATTAGHYVQISASVAGDCADAGATYPTSGQIIGFVTQTIGSAGNANVLIRPDISVPAIIPNTTSALKGNNTGGASAVTGTASDCVRVDGSSSACASGGAILAVNLQGATVGSGITTYAGAYLSTFSTEGVRGFMLPRNATLRNLRVKPSGSQPSSCTLTVTVRNFTTTTDTAITVSITNATATALVSDTTNTASASAGDFIVLKFVNGTCTSAGITGATLEAF